MGSKYAPFPDAPLVISGPGERAAPTTPSSSSPSPTSPRKRGTDEAARADYASSPNDNLIVEGIEGADTSLGWIGYSFYKAEEERMKAIAIENDEGACVAPTEETIADGSYPFSRSLYIYVNTAKAAENPAVASFVELYLSDQGLMDQVSSAGYVNLPADRIEATRSAWTS
ncbi:MAG: substrate-binding domain-containing protein [Ilumatobacteraceae bacterium]